MKCKECNGYMKLKDSRIYQTNGDSYITVEYQCRNCKTMKKNVRILDKYGKEKSNETVWFK